MASEFFREWRAKSSTASRSAASSSGAGEGRPSGRLGLLILDLLDLPESQQERCHRNRTCGGGGWCYGPVQMSGDPVDSGGETRRPSLLRLVWSNPCPPPPPRPIDLASAIEGHLSGLDG